MTKKSKKIGFNNLAKKVAKEYIEKGYSKKEAEEIGIKTAGKVYYKKLAKRK